LKQLVLISGADFLIYRFACRPLRTWENINSIVLDLSQERWEMSRDGRKQQNLRRFRLLRLFSPLSAGLLSSCQLMPLIKPPSPEAKPAPAAKPASPGAKSPTAVAQPPSNLEENFQTAQDKAEGARQLSQTAQTREDWQLIASQWQRSITLLKTLPKGHKHHKQAQTLLAEYQTGLGQANRLAQTGGALKPSSTAGSSGGGNVAISVGSSLSTEGGAQEGSANLAAINQKQLDFFTQKQRFAASLQELDKDAFLTTESYRYTAQGLDGDRAVTTAVAQVNGLPSYVGLLQLKKDAKGKVTGSLTGLCVTKNPVKSAPATPSFKDDQIQCPAGTTSV
jgi:hypothetical protein